MSEGKKYFCFCSSNCKYETMTKEQILTAITQAASGESVIDPDAGVLTKVKETNNGGYITFWVGTQAQYNALQGNIVQNCLYIITDEAAKEDISKALQQINDRLEAVEKNVADNTTTEIRTREVDKKHGGNNVTILSQLTAIDFKYMPAIGQANLRATLYLDGTMAKGEEMWIKFPKGVYSRVSIAQPNPLAVWCSNKTFGRISASLDSGAIYIRAEDGFTVNEEIIYLEGMYPCNGEVTV